jgi:hypothetical protein
MLFEQASFAENGASKAPKQSQRKRKDITDDSLQISNNVVNAQMKNTSDILRTVKVSILFFYRCTFLTSTLPSQIQYPMRP